MISAEFSHFVHVSCCRRCWLLLYFIRSVMSTFKQTTHNLFKTVSEEEYVMEDKEAFRKIGC